MNNYVVFDSVTDIKQFVDNIDTDIYRLISVCPNPQKPLGTFIIIVEDICGD